jgi:hypothetical protein
MTSQSQQYVLKRRGTTSEMFNYDQERENIFQKIVELFIAAGYFRARIQSLEPFDKVINFLKIYSKRF